MTPDEAEVFKCLRRENARLMEENENLGKAAAYFARETIRRSVFVSSTSTGTPTGGSGCTTWTAPVTTPGTNRLARQERADEEEMQTRAIREIYTGSRGPYCVLRITHRPRNQRQVVNHERVARTMCEHEIARIVRRK
jgi:hypothetical protein